MMSADAFQRCRMGSASAQRAGVLMPIYGLGAAQVEVTNGIVGGEVEAAVALGEARTGDVEHGQRLRVGVVGEVGFAQRVPEHGG